MTGIQSREKLSGKCLELFSSPDREEAQDTVQEAQDGGQGGHDVPISQRISEQLLVIQASLHITDYQVMLAQIFGEKIKMSVIFSTRKLPNADCTGLDPLPQITKNTLTTKILG